MEPDARTAALGPGAGRDSMTGATRPGEPAPAEVPAADDVPWRVTRVVRNAGWVIAASAAPALLGLAALPWLAHRLGTARFGVLLWVGTILQVAALFDLGFGRALARALAQSRVAPAPAPAIRAVTTALAGLGLGGVAGALVVFGAASPLASALRGVGALHAEAVNAVRIAAGGVAATALASGAIGALEGWGSFRAAAALRGALGASLFLAPAVVVAWRPDIVSSMAAVVVVRAVVAAVAWRGVLRAIGARIDRPPGELDAALVRFAAWVTVSGVVGAALAYGERLLLGALAGAWALAVYAPPAELALRLAGLADALVAALLPAVAAGVARGDERSLARLYGRLGVGLGSGMVGLCGALALWAPEIARLWFGSALAAPSAPVMRWLVLGLFLNTLARLPLAALYAVGRSDGVARVHLIELPFYLGLATFLVDRWGATGAAVAWAIRVAVDALALFALVHRCRLAWARAPSLGGLAAGAALVALAALAPVDRWPVAKASITGLGLLLGAGGAFVAWRAWSLRAAPRWGER